MSLGTSARSLIRDAYQDNFAYFNDALLGGELPSMTVTSYANPSMKGFYCPRADFGSEEEEIDELCLNPLILALPERDAASVLVHKMCHYWQFGHGTPCFSCRHDREWAEIMREIGLDPRVPARAGVWLCGQAVGHSIMAGGPFDQAFRRRPRDLHLPRLSTREAKQLMRAGGSSVRLSRLSY